MKNLYSIVTHKDNVATFIHDISGMGRIDSNLIAGFIRFSSNDVILSKQKSCMVIGEGGDPIDRIQGVKPKSFDEVLKCLKK